MWDGNRWSTGKPKPVTLVALGGIDPGRAATCFEAGAGAVAAIREDLTPALDAPRRPC